MRSSLLRMMMPGLLSFLFTLLPLGAQPLRLYVDNSKSDYISVIDLDSLKVSGEVKVGASDIHGLAVRADGQLLVVTVESDHSLRFIDAKAQQLTGVVKLSGKPNQCAITPDGRYVVLPIRDGGKVDIVDAQQKKVVKELPIQEPHNAVNNGSNRYMFVSSMGSNQINVIDLQTMSFSKVIPAGGRPRPFVMTPDGKTLYVALANLHGFEIVDLQNNDKLRRVEMPAQHAAPLHPLRYETPDTLTHGLALTKDGAELWVTSLLDNCVYIYDVKSGAFVGHLPTGEGPNWIVFSPDGKLVCVSNADTDDVSIFDVRLRREVARVKVGRVPKRLAIGTMP